VTSRRCDEPPGGEREGAREILRLAVPGGLDQRVRDQLIAEARGNPLALRELPRALNPAQIASGLTLSSTLPLENRIEQSLVVQLASLPAPAPSTTRTAEPGTGPAPPCTRTRGSPPISNGPRRVRAHAAARLRRARSWRGRRRSPPRRSTADSG
jgi:hypothetical protein